MKWLIILFTLSTATVFSQTFPTDVGQFYEEINKRFAVQTSPKAKQLQTQLTTLWSDRLLSEKQKAAVISTTNLLATKGTPFYPGIANWLGCLLFTQGSAGQIQVNFDSLVTKINQYVNESNKPNLQLTLVKVEEIMSTGTYNINGKRKWKFSKAKADIVVDYTNPNTGSGYSLFIGFKLHEHNLEFVSDEDSSVIKKTSGTINLTDGIFNGLGGRYDWTKVALQPDDLFVTDLVYTLTANNPYLIINKCALNYKGLKPGSLVGRLIDKLPGNVNVLTSKFPTFISDSGSVEIANISDGANYEGGLLIEGRNINGVKTLTTPATLWLLQPSTEKKVVKLVSSYINLTDRPIAQKAAGYTIYLPGDDSISHPSTSFIYYPEKRTIDLFKDIRSPYNGHPANSSFHKYLLFVDRITWEIGNDTLWLKATYDQKDREAAIESEDFFRPEYYRSYGVYTEGFHPLGIIYKYLKERKKINLANQVKKQTQPKSSISTNGLNDSFGTEEFKVDDYSDSAYDYLEGFDFGDEAPEESGPSQGGRISFSQYYSERHENSAASDPIYANEILKFYKMDQRLAAFEDALYQLQIKGFLKYNSTTKEIIPLKRFYIWVNAAFGTTDYDVVQIISKHAQSNGYILFSTKALNLWGVSSFGLSDLGLVSVRPEGNKILADSNRQLRFGGLIYGGKMSLFGQGFDKFEFDYNEFRIECLKLDSIKFAPKRDPNFNPSRNPRLTKALEQLKLEGVNGAIYLNAPSNKSGKKQIAGYPIFDCYTNSYVFWSGQSIQAGIYDRRRLNFALDPFGIDSLESFLIDNLEFYGEFYSGHIFPAFRDTLKPVSDNTYGIKELFTAPVKIYNGKGQYKSNIQMDGFGLHGNGELTLRNMAVESDTMVFHFDSVMGKVRSLHVPEGTFENKYYPKLEMEGGTFVWDVNNDRIRFKTGKNPIILLGGRGLFSGELVIGKTGAWGNGTFSSGQVKYVSDSIDISNLKIQALNSSFTVLVEGDSSKYHFRANNVNITHDIVNRVAKFSTVVDSNSSGPGKIAMQFPTLNYESSMSEGEHDDKSGIIRLTSRYLVKRFNQFVSTKADQKGLAFAGETAEYNSKEMVLNVSGVDSILVADAAVFPKRKGIRINAKGNVEPLDSATIRIDTTSGYHKINNAHVEIASKTSYKGNGIYPYNSKGLPTQNITFESIITLPDNSTYASATILENESFLITDRIFFRNTVTLEGKQRFLGFDGEVRIEIDDPFFADSWIKFKNPSVNPDTVIVPVNYPTNKRGVPLAIGLLYAPARRAFYTRFFREKRERTDLEVLLANGGLTYDRVASSFRVGPPEKINLKQYKGGLAAYDDKKKVISLEGRLNIPVNYPANSTNLAFAGKWLENENTGEVNTNLILGIQLSGLTKPTIDALHSQLALYVINNNNIDYSDRLLQQSLAELIDPDSNSTEENIMKFVVEALTANNYFDIKPHKYLSSYSMVLSNVKLIYNDSIRGFYSKEPVGVISIGDHSVNKLMQESKIEYRKGRRLPNGTNLSDTLRMYLRFDEVSWIYFELVDNELRTISSEVTYNRFITEQAERDSKRDNDPDKPFQKSVLLSEDAKNRFVRLFSRYLLR